MKAVRMTQFSIEGLVIDDLPKPPIAPHQLLVRVKAASLNYLDLLVVKGIFNNQLALPHIPVTDVAGVVEAVGANVTQFEVGDSVIPTFIRLWQKGLPAVEELSYADRPALGRPGYLAQYLAIDATDVVKKPDSLSYEEAATLPIAALSAWSGIKYLGLQPGNSVLVYGTGGVSTFAVLFAKAMGLRVLVAGRNDASLRKISELGVYKTYNVTTRHNWKEDLLAETGGRGVDGIYESVGGNNINHSLDVVAIRGSITCVGIIDGFTMNVQAGKLLWKQARLIGVECGSTQDLEEMIEAIQVNRIKPVIDKVFPLEQTRDAFQYLEAGGHVGKVVITL